MPPTPKIYNKYKHMKKKEDRKKKTYHFWRFQAKWIAPLDSAEVTESGYGQLGGDRRSKRDLKPSGIQFYTVFNDFHVKKMSFSKKCRKSILTSVEIRKKLRWIRICNPFCLKPSKFMSFWRFSFLTFFVFLHFFIFLGSAAWGFSL